MDTTTGIPHGYYVDRQGIHEVETAGQMSALTAKGVRAWGDNVLREGRNAAVEWAARQIMVEPDEIMALVVWGAGTGTWCVNALRAAR